MANRYLYHTINVNFFKGLNNISVYKYAEKCTRGLKKNVTLGIEAEQAQHLLG